MKRHLLAALIIIAGLNYSHGQPAPDYLLKAQALSETGRVSDALSILTTEIERGAGASALIMRADIFLSGGNLEMAEADFVAANKSEPGSGFYGLARLSAMRGEAALSVKHLKESLGYNTRKKEKEIMLDKAFSRIENSPEWRQFWKNHRFSEEGTRLSEVEYYITTGKREVAQRIASEMVGLNPDSAESLFARALVDFSFQKYQDVLTAMPRILKSDSRNPAYLELQAKAQMGAGNAAGASVTYTRMIESGARDASLYLRRAECYFKTGEFDRSMQDINKYLGFYEFSKEAIRMAGRVSVAMGDNLKAIAHYSRNIELYPGDAGCYVDRAGAYFSARSWDLASKDYGMALDLEPGNAETWLNMGITLINLGKTEDACYYFGRAHAMGNRQAVTWVSRHCIR